MRETEKIVKFEQFEREFIIKKMVAVEGISILKELLTRSLPIDLLGSLEDAGVNTSAIKGFTSGVKQEAMSIDEFNKLQTRILRNVKVVLPSGEVNLLDKMENYQVEGIECDMLIVSKLLFEVVKFNYVGFFTDALQELGLIIPDEDQKK